MFISKIKMLKMSHFFHIFCLFICFLGLTSGQESIEYLNLHGSSSHGGFPVAVPVRNNDLVEVSSSVLTAEVWLRTHVLANFPSTKITTILVGEESDFLCKKDQNHNLGLVLLSLKNVYHSLKRWGLEKDIKVSTFLSPEPDCLGEKTIKPLLEFLKSTNSSFSVHFPSFSQESLNLLHSQHDFVKKFESLESGRIKKQDFVKKFESFESGKLNVEDFMKKFESFELEKLNMQDFMKQIGSLGFRKINVEDLMKKIESLGFRKINFIISTPNERKTISRKLAAMEASPSSIAKSPHSPNSPTISLPPLSLPVDSPPPPLPPAFAPANPPFGSSLPPCNPYNGNAPAPAPQLGAVQKFWCVAKPSVPAETLQEAIDYACGEGGGDCQEIMPNGSCFEPDTVVAHASYAFNSYWQKTKRNGGTCSFGGTAMIINADPSFLQCRFVLS